MFQRIFLSAIIAGILSGLIVTALHHVTTVPIIIQAETYENAAPAKQSAFLKGAHPYLILAHGPATTHNDGPRAWAPADGLERTAYTALTTIITAIGFALLLTAGYAITRQQVSGSTGVMWGVAGFAALSLAPGLGLPPELPGSEAAELVSRQLWWLGTATASVIGIALLVFSNGQWLWRLGGILLLIAPHAIGAPQPDHFGSPVPAELGGHFAAASLATAFVMWTLLGWFSATLYQRFAAE